MCLCSRVAFYCTGRNQISASDSCLACRFGENGRILLRKWGALVMYQDILARWFNFQYQWLFFVWNLSSSRFFSRANKLVDTKIFRQRLCTALCLWEAFELKAIPSLSLHSSVLWRWEMKWTYKATSWILTDKQCTRLHTNSAGPQPQHLWHNTTCGSETTYI